MKLLLGILRFRLSEVEVFNGRKNVSIMHIPPCLHWEILDLKMEMVNQLWRPISHVKNGWYGQFSHLNNRIFIITKPKDDYRGKNNKYQEFSLLFISHLAKLLDKGKKKESLLVFTIASIMKCCICINFWPEYNVMFDKNQQK